eukprot:scaffold4031_cov135-Cylindrotheca_fusiformis.AAC.9
MRYSTRNFLTFIGVVWLGHVSGLKSPSDRHFASVAAGDKPSNLLQSDSFSYEMGTASVLRLNGGGSKKKLEEQVDSTVGLKISAAILIPSLVLLIAFRDKWLKFFDKEKLQAKTLEILHELDALPNYISYTVYIIGMAFWELIGASTIPVETAAGMVFGWDGFILSGSGKLLGATIAFIIGRYGILAEWIEGKLSSNSFLQLVRRSTDKNPLLVAFLFKCSAFPETIKNYGSAIVKPIELWMFILATCIHGWTFSALWTYLGVDAAARLETADLPADRLLEFLLGAALLNGIIVSPLVMAYWIQSLKSHDKPKTKPVVQPPPKKENVVLKQAKQWAVENKLPQKVMARANAIASDTWESVEQETKDRLRRLVLSSEELLEKQREKSTNQSKEK